MKCVTRGGLIGMRWAARVMTCVADAATSSILGTQRVMCIEEMLGIEKLYFSLKDERVEFRL